MEEKSKELELQSFSTESSTLTDNYVVYRRRYLMATLFSLSTICSSMMFSTCNPIAAQLTHIYHVTPSVISLAANGFFLMHPLCTFLQTYITDRYSIGVSLRIGCLLTLLGAGVRTLTGETDRFITIIFGQILGGIGRPFIINLQANVARDWFPAKDKTTVMIAFSFLVTCSNILGVLIPGLVFAGYHHHDEDGKQLTSQLMNIEFLIFTAMLLPPILLFQSKPPTPPGPISKNDHLYSYRQSLTIMAKNRDFVLLFCCYSLIMGGFHALAVVIAFLFTPFGFTPTQISIIQSAPIFCGFLSSIAYSIYIRSRTPDLQWIVKVSLLPVLFVLLTLYPVLKIENFWILLCSCALLGVFMIPIIPLQLELACRVLYPINQSMAVGFLLAGVHLWSFVFGESLSYVTNHQSKKQALEGCALLFASFAVAYGCFMKVHVPPPNEDAKPKIEDESGAI